jgi:hypothetical protein
VGFGRVKSVAGKMGAYGRASIEGPAVSYRELLKIALWHSRECGKAIERACAALGIDPDESVEESGLAPRPPDGDVSGPDYIEPTLFDDEIDDNPQGKRAAYLRLIKSAAAIRSW